MAERILTGGRPLYLLTLADSFSWLLVAWVCKPFLPLVTWEEGPQFPSLGVTLFPAELHSLEQFAYGASYRNMLPFGSEVLVHAFVLPKISTTAESALVVAWENEIAFFVLHAVCVPTSSFRKGLL